MIDDLRAYWDAQPCNANHSNAEPSSLEYFEQVRRRKYFVEPHIPDFAQFQRWRGKRVLDLGCGLGTMAVDFALAGADVTALDFSSESLFLVAQNFRRHDLNGLLVNANIEERLVYLSGFDLVFAFGVLHHTPRPERAIANAYHYLKPGGEFRLMVYHKWSTKAAAVALGLARPEAQAGCPLARTYTRRGVRRLLKRAGFRVISMRVDHIFPWRIADYKAYRYVKARPWRWLPARAFRWLEKHLGWHLLVVARKD
jgi:SAM-dependent methyltransferase